MSSVLSIDTFLYLPIDVSLFRSKHQRAKLLTGYGRVESEGLQAGELFAPGLLHAVAEDALPGVQLQQLDAPQQLIGLLQTLAGVFL